MQNCQVQVFFHLEELDVSCATSHHGVSQDASWHVPARLSFAVFHRQELICVIEFLKRRLGLHE